VKIQSNELVLTLEIIVSKSSGFMVMSHDRTNS